MGILRSRPHKLDMVIGARYGRLVVIGKAIRPTLRFNIWIFQCDCGKRIEVIPSRVTSGLLKGCGCRRTIHRKLTPGTASFHSVLRMYRTNAKKAHRALDISIEDFKRLTSSDCHYCGIRPFQIRREGKVCNGAYLFNGLDRVDNLGGYTLDNVVPCCKRCNYAKHNSTYAEFIEWLDNLVEYRKCS